MNTVHLYFRIFFFYFYKNGIDCLLYIAFCLSNGIIQESNNYINCNISKEILLNILYLKFII